MENTGLPENPTRADAPEVGTGQQPTQEQVLSWVLFRVMESLQEPVLVRAAARAASEYALAGIRYLMSGEVPPEYFVNLPVQFPDSQQATTDRRTGSPE